MRRVEEAIHQYKIGFRPSEYEAGKVAAYTEGIAFSPWLRRVVREAIERERVERERVATGVQPG